MKKKYLDEFNAYIRKSEKNTYKRNLLLAAVISTAVLSAGCQNGHKKENVTSPNNATTTTASNNNVNTENIDTENSNTENNQVIDSKTTEMDNSDTITPEEATIAFSEIAKYQFVFSSGAGAWQTMLNINEDGTFQGYYSDSDMGVTGEGYPNGIVYEFTFEGKFTTPKRVNDYTYSVSIETLKLEKEVGSEEIIDGIKYIYSEPYGLNDAKEIYIYTTKAPIKELPEGFRSWVGYMDLDNAKEEYLPFYGLYNVETESGFSSYVIEGIEEENPNLDIIAEVEEIEKQYKEMNDRLKNEDLNQLQMNFLAEEIYVLWDDEINKIWRYLKDTLDKETMDQLTSEQREWITKKESEINKAGSVYEGGSIRPMIEFLKGAELTRERVYELIQLIQ